jgi:hypothetical protein
MVLEKRGEIGFLEAAKIILTNNKNKPMSANEIWNSIVEEGLSSKISYKETRPSRPSDSLYYMLLKSSINSETKSQYKTKYFEIVGENPKKFKMVESEVKSFKNFSDDSSLKKIKDTEEIKSYSINPFKQAICVLGESGAGKSVTVEQILDFEGHEYEFIIPTATTTNILSQFSPSKSTYVPSRLAKLIIDAAKNPTKMYTAVFDEMHKSNIIQMVNDEILHAISTKRFDGKRLISLDYDTGSFFDIPELKKWRGNILIPDNLGFIFISSKPRIISNNPDLFNRLDIVILTEEDRGILSTEDLIEKVLPPDEKRKLSSTRTE